jgi:hypothetical protein
MLNNRSKCVITHSCIILFVNLAELRRTGLVEEVVTLYRRSISANHSFRHYNSIVIKFSKTTLTRLGPVSLTLGSSFPKYMSYPFKTHFPPKPLSDTVLWLGRWGDPEQTLWICKLPLQVASCVREYPCFDSRTDLMSLSPHKIHLLRRRCLIATPPCHSMPRGNPPHSLHLYLCPHSHCFSLSLSALRYGLFFLCNPPHFLDR